MQLIETNTEGLKRTFKVVVLAGDLALKVDAKLIEIGKTIRLPGFRPGKVPKALLRQRYARSIMGEILESTAKETVETIITEHNLRPAMQPKIEVTSFPEGGDLEFAIEVEQLPDIQLLDFGALKLERPRAEVDDSSIDEVLSRMASGQKRTEAVSEERKSVTGDTLVIDFIGKTGGELISGGAGTDHHLELGSNSFIPGFEDALIGKSVGENVSFDVTFPAEYHAELAGKEATFDVVVKELRQKAPIVIDDELAKLFDLDSLDALRKAIHEQLERDYETASRTKLKRALLDSLADSYSFELPPGVVGAEFDSIWTQLEQARKDGSLDAEDRDKSDDVLREEYRAVAERRVRLGLVLAEVGRKNNITVTQDDFNRAMRAEAGRYPGQEEMVVDFYRKNPDAVSSLQAPLFEDKVVNFILEMVTITDKTVTVAELLDEEGAETSATPQSPAPKRKRAPAKTKKSESE